MKSSLQAVRWPCWSVPHRVLLFCQVVSSCGHHLRLASVEVLAQGCRLLALFSSFPFVCRVANEEDSGRITSSGGGRKRSVKVKMRILVPNTYPCQPHMYEISHIQKNDSDSTSDVSVCVSECVVYQSPSTYCSNFLHLSVSYTVQSPGFGQY